MLCRCVCILYSCTHKHKHAQQHVSFTQHSHAHTQGEQSFEPAAEIQVALDHFTTVFISICLSSYSLFCFFLAGYLDNISLDPPPLCLFFFPFSLLIFSLCFVFSFRSHYLMFSELIGGVRMLTFILSVAAVYFHAKLLCIAGYVVTLHKHMLALTLHTLQANYNRIYLVAQWKWASQPVLCISPNVSPSLCCMHPSVHWHTIIHVCVYRWWMETLLELQQIFKFQ